MKDYVVPIAIQEMLDDRAYAYCKRELPQVGYRYFVDSRGKFIYLVRMWPNGAFQRLGRLTYEEDTEKMAFAIYKFSSGKYDPKDWWFPGSQYLDGTIEGALRALTKAYP